MDRMNRRNFLRAAGTAAAAAAIVNPATPLWARWLQDEMAKTRRRKLWSPGVELERGDGFADALKKELVSQASLYEQDAVDVTWDRVIAEHVQNAGGPQVGTLVYNTTTDEIQAFNGRDWVPCFTDRDILRGVDVGSFELPDGSRMAVEFNDFMVDHLPLPAIQRDFA